MQKQERFCSPLGRHCGRRSGGGGGRRHGRGSPRTAVHQEWSPAIRGCSGMRHAHTTCQGCGIARRPRPRSAMSRWTAQFQDSTRRVPAHPAGASPHPGRWAVLSHQNTLSTLRHTGSTDGVEMHRGFREDRTGGVKKNGPSRSRRPAPESETTRRVFLPRLLAGFSPQSGLGLGLRSSRSSVLSSVGKGRLANPLHSAASELLKSSRQGRSTNPHFGVHPGPCFLKLPRPGLSISFDLTST